MLVKHSGKLNAAHFVFFFEWLNKTISKLKISYYYWRREEMFQVLQRMKAIKLALLYGCAWLWVLKQIAQKREKWGKKCREAWERERFATQICRNPLETVNCMHFQTTIEKNTKTMDNSFVQSSGLQRKTFVIVHIRLCFVRKKQKKIGNFAKHTFIAV